MRSKFEPDYRNFVAASRNIAQSRIPLYEHGVCLRTMENLTGQKIEGLYESARPEQIRELMRRFCNFWRQMGYDTVTWEIGITSVMPGNGALGAHLPGCIKKREDFDKYPWGKITDLYFDKWSTHYEILREVMPEGMKAVAGPGNGVFECVQDVVGYEHLCMLTIDDPQLYDDLFKAAGDMIFSVWKRFLEHYGDIYAVCRFGDDLGYRSGTMLAPNDVKDKILPQYKRIVDLVHSYDKPFFLHSCGCIFDVMEEMINYVGIDGKHSNEDAIAPFSVWVEKYGDRICNYGGVDVDVLCQQNSDFIRKYTLDILENCQDKGGIILGSGNSIPDYVPVESYMTMVNTIREFRGDF